MAPSPIVKAPSMAILSAVTLTALERLPADPRNVVYIISGRDGEFLEQHLGRLRHAGFSAEHGGFMRAPGEETWVNLMEQLDGRGGGGAPVLYGAHDGERGGDKEELNYVALSRWRSGMACRHRQDLLENNLAHERPIEVLVGNRNLEVRPIAVNKGEIVERLLYKNPDAEFIFCAGDDKTDEDMFRTLILFGTGATKVTMETPLSVTPLDEDSGKDSPKGSGAATPVELTIKPDCVFTTAVGHSSKRTLASWHVTTPQEIVEHMLGLVGETASAQSHL